MQSISFPTSFLVYSCAKSVWLQDFPPRRSPVPYDRKADDFPAQFERVLQSLNISAGLKAIMHDVRVTLFIIFWSFLNPPDSILIFL